MTGGETAALALAVPLAGAALIALADKRPNLRETVTLLTAGILFSLVLSLYPRVIAGEAVAFTFFPVMPGVSLAFKVEPLGLLYALLASFLWILNSLYSIGYMRGNNEPHQTRYYICFALALASAIGVAFAGNIFTLFVFYEALTLSTYPLVTHKGTPEAIRSGRTYLGVLLATSIGFQLLAIIWIYSLTTGVAPAVANLDFVPGGIFAGALESGAVSPELLGLLFFLFIYGIGKAALMPVHRWLPAAMVAPTPVSALLHAVAVVKAGVFAVVKVTVYVFGIDTLRIAGTGDWLVYAAGATILIASMIALYQDNLKLRLAYSTISQLAYIVMAAALLTPLAIMAAALHIVMHAFGKITLFFAAGSIYTAARKTKVSQLDGIGRRMPWTMGAFAVGALSLIGVPPAAGFISKWFLVGGIWDAMQAGGSGWETKEVFALVVIGLSTLLNAAYFLPIVYRSFFKPLPEAAETDSAGAGDHYDHGEAPWPMVAALVCTAAGTVLSFLNPGPVLALARALKEAIS